jgi:hypothetical protein
MQRMVCFVVALTALVAGTGCSDGDGGTCEEGPYFSILPVPLESIEAVIPLGQFNPPGDVYPRAQSGMMNTGPVNVVVPGPIRVRSLRRTTWLASPTREGASDYSVSFTVQGCRPIEGVFGHLNGLAPDLDARLVDEHCETYSTEAETVEACSSNTDFTMAAGEAVGIIDGATAAGLDFDLYDTRVEHPFISPQRVHLGVLRAICMQHLFEEPLATLLTDLVQRGGVQRTDEPRCGTMDIDREGTAQGMWITEGPDAVLSGETYHRFLALAPHDILPSSHQVIAAAIPDLDPEHLHVFPRETTGRVNLDFEQVLPNDAIHCYFAEASAVATGYPGWKDHSFFVALDGDGILTIERVTHATDDSPCANDPSTWAFGAGALRYMR